MVAAKDESKDEQKTEVKKPLQSFFYPGDLQTPSKYIEAESREEADKIYEKHVKESSNG